MVLFTETDRPGNILVDQNGPTIYKARNRWPLRFKNMAGYLSDIMFHRKQAIVVSRLDPMDLVRAPLEYRANN